MTKDVNEEIEKAYSNPKHVPMQTTLVHTAEKLSPAMKARFDKIFQRLLTSDTE
jgi:hypothetical protein